MRSAPPVLFGLLRGERAPSRTWCSSWQARSLPPGACAPSPGNASSSGVGFFVASTNLAFITCSELLAGHLFERPDPGRSSGGRGGGWRAGGLPLLVWIATPVFEAIFGYVSDRRLAELCNLNQPALKELIVRAPGTYHHSILLGRVWRRAQPRPSAANPNPHPRDWAPHHDLGKGKAPLVFLLENQKGGRETVAVDELAEMLRRHVDDGVELGRKHKLPRLLLEAMAQHCMERARSDRAPKGAWAEGFISEIRYRGPRPRRPRDRAGPAGRIRSRPRAVGWHGPGDLARLARRLIQAAVMQIAAEGQLDESELKLGDLPKIVESFAASLARILAERGAEPTPPSRSAARRVPQRARRQLTSTVRRSYSSQSTSRRSLRPGAPNPRPKSPAICRIPVAAKDPIEPHPDGLSAADRPVRATPWRWHAPGPFSHRRQ